jgi:hypothetical protein
MSSFLNALIKAGNRFYSRIAWTDSTYWNDGTQWADD